MIGVDGRDMIGLVLALEGIEEFIPDGFMLGLRPTLYSLFVVCIIGLVKRDEGFDGVWLFELPFSVCIIGLVKRDEGFDGVWPFEMPFVRWCSFVGTGVDMTSNCRHFLTKFFALLANNLSVAFLRSSLMCLPRRLT